jgi:acyl-coenzyme A synthetase/AMP-(fatty) acid ligase
LRKLDSVDRAEVVVQQEDGKAKLIAFVVPNKPASDGLPQILRRQLGTSLPPFMIPSRIVQLDSIPCLPGGKVDAAALLRLLGS